MIEALIVALREGTEAVLAVALILGCLERTGQRGRATSVWLGAAMAVVASVLGAVVLGQITVDEEALEGCLQIAAAVFVASMLVWTHRAARTIGARVAAAIEPAATPTAGRLSPGLVAFTFVMVLREGLETVVFLSAMTFSTDTIATLVGGLAGLTLAGVFGVALLRGTIAIDVGRFLRATEWVLAILLLQLAVGGYHELAEAGWLPSGKTAMRIIGPLVRHGTLAVVALTLLPLTLVMTAGGRAPEVPQGASGPERRLVLARTEGVRMARGVALASGLAVVLLLNVGYVFAQRGLALDPPVPVTAAGLTVAVPVADMPASSLRRFGMAAGGATVRFLVHKDASGKLRAALDLCEICGPSGYVADGGQLICLNCTAAINPASLGATGGCNPVPLPATRDGARLVVRTRDLLRVSRDFGEVGPEVVCPVCGMKVAIDRASAQVPHGSRTFYFCSMGRCLSTFLADPGRFARDASRLGRMRPGS